jgi:hypothetical protein
MEPFMTQRHLDPDELLARLTRLEHRQRFPRPLAAVAIITTVATLVAFATGAPEAIQAQRVELVNAKGVRQATLAADTAGVVLTLLDGKGRVAAALRLDGDPRVSVLSASGREVASLGAPRPQHLDQ